MFAVAFTSSKGGCGKSTACINVAVAAAETGKRICVIDLDEQASCLSWIERRRGTNAREISVEPADANSLGAAVRQAKLNYDMVFVDVPGGDGRLLASACRTTDLSLICTRPTQLDVEVAFRVGEVFRRFNVRYGVLINQAPPGFTQRVVAWMEACRAIGDVVRPICVYRFDYQTAISAGCGVTEWNPAGAAAHEIRGVYSWIAAATRT